MIVCFFADSGGLHVVFFFNVLCNCFDGMYCTVRLFTMVGTVLRTLATLFSSVFVVLFVFGLAFKGHHKTQNMWHGVRVVYVEGDGVYFFLLRCMVEFIAVHRH